MVFHRMKAHAGHPVGMRDCGNCANMRITCHDDIARGLEALARIDPRLAAAMALAGPVPLRLKEPGYAALAEIVLSQMVSKASADALWRRLEQTAGAVTPQAIHDLDDEALRVAGLSRGKAGTLKRLAEAVMSGHLDLEGLCRTDARLATGALMNVKGIGPWTAEVYLLFCAGHADILPAGDIALQNAAAHILGLDERPDARALAKHAEIWSPWRGVAARLLWAYYAVHMGRDAAPVAEKRP